MSLLARELRLGLERGWDWLSGTVFLFAFLAAVAFGTGGNAVALSALGPGLLWVALVFGGLLAAPGLFRDDLQSGALDQLRLRGHTLAGLALAKVAAVGVLVMLPLVAAGMLGSLLVFVEGVRLWRWVAAAVVGAPALAGYTVLAGALLARRGAGGLLGILVALPLLAPVLVFGTEAVDSAAAQMWRAPELLALAGLSLISVVVGTFGGAAALQTQSE